ncbi:MAG: hypothetical protein ABW321_13085 [Polyangiales bacterium]
MKDWATVGTGVRLLCSSVALLAALGCGGGEGDGTNPVASGGGASAPAPAAGGSTAPGGAAGSPVSGGAAGGSAAGSGSTNVGAGGAGASGSGAGGAAAAGGAGGTAAGAGAAGTGTATAGAGAAGAGAAGSGAAGAGAAGGNGLMPGATGAATFSAVYSEILTKGATGNCMFGACHGSANVMTNGGLAIPAGDKATAYKNLVNAKSTGPVCMGKTYVVPGDSANSLIVQKLGDAPPCGGKMPIGTPLTAAQIAQVAKWIDDGAKDD